MRERTPKNEGEGASTTGKIPLAGGTEKVRAYLAIDIGGTKTAYAVVTRRGRILHHMSTATPRVPAQEAVEAILATARQVSGPFRLAGCGIAVPAVVEAGTLTWTPDAFLGWAGIPLEEHATRALGVPCAVEYDGYAAALGERWLGRSRGVQDSVVVIVGTGVGAGFIHDGRLLRGSSGVAGAIGWLTSIRPDRPGEPLEDIASGTAILRNARLRQPRAVTQYPNTAGVFDAAAAGDPIAGQTIAEAISALGAAVGALISILAPQIVVLGGGVGSRPDVVDRVREVALQTAQPRSAAVVLIEPSSLGGQSSLMGAAYLATRAWARREFGHRGKGPRPPSPD